MTPDFYSDKLAAEKFKEGLERLFELVGENPARDGLLETPKRVLAAYLEMTSGYKINVDDLFKTFESEGYDGMVVLGPISFTSLCEHHLLPFTGQAWVGYLPNRKTRRIIGLSKLARLVEAYSRRLQVQERLTTEIASALMTSKLQSSGAGVLLESHHLCMSVRGVRKAGAIMRTQTLLGNFRQSTVRQEFDTLCAR